MGASRPGATAAYRLAGVLAVLLVAALGIATPASTAVVPAGAAGFAAPAAPPVDPARTAVPDAVGPRIAFTAARDAIATVTVFDGEGGPGVAATGSSVPPFSPAPVHEGDLSSNATGAQAFISTRDDPRGEVYFIAAAGSPTVQPPPVRVTCDNTEVESHPVISPDGKRVAYATDASGVFRLRLAVLDPAQKPCSSTVYDLAGTRGGADTWPTWLSDQWLAFSSTKGDPLGDIWAQYVGLETPPPPNPAIRLTTGPAAETQPASVDMNFDESGQTILMFTTTQYRADGSIGAMTLPELLTDGDATDLLDGGGTTVYSPWAGDRNDPPQGSQAALTRGSEGGVNLAFSTTDGDPYGDVVAVIGDYDGFWENEVALPQPFGLGDSHLDIANLPGRAETQPVWLPGVDPDSLRVSYTQRTPPATIDDVRAADGTGRRTIANEEGTVGGDLTLPLDESTPSYSPDGTRLAYSRIGPTGQGREIVVSGSTGGAPVAVDPNRPAPVLDSEPAWSPDGTRVAFIRTYLCGESCPVSGSKLWIADVAKRRARLVTLNPAGAIAWDQHPSWSPDGTRIAIGRTLEAPPDLTASFAAKSLTVENGASVEADLTVTNRGLGAARHVQISLPPDQSASLFTVAAPLDLSCSNYRYASSYCVVATIPAGKSRTFRLRVTGDQQATGTDSLIIQTAVLGTPSEISTGNNEARIPVTVQASTPTTPPTPSPSSTFEVTDWYLPPSGPGTASRFAFAAWSPSKVATRRVSLSSGRPAGIREVFAAPPAGDVSTLWVVDASTGVGHQLATPAPTACQCVRTIEGRSPAWSPDGMRIAYEHHGSVRLVGLADRRGAAIAVSNEVPHVQMVTGFTQEYQHEVGRAGASGAPTPSRTTISAAQDPAWSPDGAWIVLSGQPAGSADNPGVYRLRPTAANLTVVAQEAGPETEPAWQPWASLAVSLTASPSSISIASQTVLTATVANPGPGTSARPVLAMALPAGLTPGMLPSGCVITTTTSGSLITCTLESLRPEAAPPPATGLVAATISVRIAVTGTVLGPHTVTAAVGSASPDDLATDNEASTSITVTSAVLPVTDTGVTVAMNPTPGYVGGTGTVTVVVANRSSVPVTDVTLTVLLPTFSPSQPSAITPPPGTVEIVGTPECFTGAPCDPGPIAPGGSRSFTATVKLVTAGTSTITASVVTATVADSDPANNSASVALVVLQPVVRLLQPVADPGSVVLAVGSDFPPGTQVTLSWDAGVNVRAAPLTVAADGTIRATQILIFRRDQLGPRNLVATATDERLFAPVQDSLMVAPRTVAPPADFASRS
ncbi:hypothetical protein BA895_06825 [Humibacillus sp. DSM 29435]|uniref:DUF11 domain-containing protein n=1 Tax=Humibacillus sp. DSM 29435 TaxID=1869167 RepID=UPI00087347E8|nr:DUF11 domain-containing protein [Humibacillus sp. DSM 29435]OFE15415.1 hypothetical protein BA895_06825 [Humibacillus sp. DSM 29435]